VLITVRQNSAPVSVALTTVESGEGIVRAIELGNTVISRANGRNSAFGSSVSAIVSTRAERERHTPARRALTAAYVGRRVA
jgi:hypothetical protein